MQSKATDLIQKHCVPCEGGTKPLTQEEAAPYLQAVPHWIVDDEGKKIKRTFVFKDFMEAVDFINRIAAVAQQEGHHPDLKLFNYKKVSVTLSTHAINGLSTNDFILAAKTDTLV
ncbi:MAG: 4a-hydroxytetrahydrobiopterin dehydratase [Candidatus Roizmanbacteria bacterium]|nr:4a-hydroxytetrahydrobiopterin dehydratase [Candidatus Roizmanbacteria bacterium]